MKMYLQFKHGLQKCAESGVIYNCVFQCNDKSSGKKVTEPGRKGVAE